MGRYGLFFFSEEIAQLEAFRATLKDEAEIEKVDEAIRVLKARGVK